MSTIDLSFKVTGSTIPLDHGYALFSALCRVVPDLHGSRRVGVHPIRGIRDEPRRLSLVPQSKLRLRMPSEEIGRYLEIAGRSLDLEGARLTVGFPRVEPLITAPNLLSRLVTIGHLVEPGPFEESIRRQLRSLGVAAAPTLIAESDPSRAGRPARRVLRVKGRRIVGYAVRVAGLTAEESLVVQENGLGSRRRMGCGLFVREGGPRTHG